MGQYEGDAEYGECFDETFRAHTMPAPQRDACQALLSGSWSWGEVWQALIIFEFYIQESTNDAPETGLTRQVL